MWTVNGQLLGAIRRGKVPGFEISASACALRLGAVYSRREYVVTGHCDGRVRFWRIDPKEGGVGYDMRCHWTLEGTGDEVTALSTSVACRELAAGDRNGKAIVWRPNLDAGGPFGAVASLRLQCGAVDSFCNALDEVGGGTRGDDHEPATWMSQAYATKLLLAGGDCTKPYSLGWEHPARGMHGIPCDGNPHAVGVFSSLYAHCLRSAVEELEERTGRKGGVDSVDGVVRSFSGSSWSEFWAELAECVAGAFSLDRGWFGEALLKWAAVPSQATLSASK